MSHFRKVILMMLVVSLVAPAYSLVAGTLKGITMEDTIEVDGQKLVLNGMALRKKLFWKVYVAGLYLTQKENSGEKILKADTARKTVMQFMRSVPAKKINDAWMEGLEDNTPKASAELKEKFKKLCTYMEDLKDKDILAFTYIPGQGTTVEVKGKNKGVFEGKDFADALFACWIGEEPGPGNGFKEDLLGID